ncbi:hypothetical protein FAM09_16175 [Niastella caeni]|uniref:Uncharacterized protein n=1 Tax=Niastella caeni TaxID=2569763 RepID=A0A4S8HSE0_9BACT|nr:hypothetical protein [Niastella caeni]THU38215.1 hypothetical protein FAM09_16175 [Niastella caeni]
MTPEEKSTSYLSAAKSLFDILKQDYQDNGIPRVFKGSTNYWMAGNVFDTALDYMRLAMANNMITRQEVDSVLAYVNKNYDRTHQSYNATYKYYKNDNGIPDGEVNDWPASATGSMYDDYCWWGIASAKAYSSAYQTIFQNYTSQFDAIARSCWNVVENGIKVDQRPAQFGAPNVWANCPEKFAAVEPRITGGAWQCDINDCSDPFNSSLGPFQDTVMNGLYMVFALRMNRTLNTSAQISREYKFLATWCFGDDIKEYERLFYNIPNKGGLVQERIATYKNGKPVPPEWWHYVHTAWCGDQGLILGAMVQYYPFQPSLPDAMRLIKGIMQGVPENMQLNSILMPWYPLTDNPLEGIDKADYASGVGVYMRYLLYAYKNSTAVKGWVDSNQYGIKGMIRNNADACVAGKFPDYGNGIFDLFNKLSILITAATILQGADEAAEVDNSAD